jgi:O-antigen ligase
LQLLQTIQNKINFQKVFFYLVITFAFILPLSRALISLIIILLILFWVLEGNFKLKLKAIKNDKLLFAIAIFILWSLVSIFWSDISKDLYRGIRLNLYLVALFVIATSIKKEQIPSIITAFLAGMFVSEIIAYGVFFEIWSFGHATPVTPSPFMMHIDYSVFLALSSVLLLNRLFSSLYSTKEKLVMLFFFFTVTGNLFLSTGRTGQVALIAALIVLPIIHYRVSIKSFSISLILLVVIFFSAYNLSSSFVMRVNNTKTDIEKILNSNLNGSWGTRAAYWIITFDSFKEHPLGSGLGNHKYAIQEQVTKQNYQFINNRTKQYMGKHHPHNQYLLVLLQSGFIGLILFLNIIYQLLKYKMDTPEIKELSILFVTIYFVSCFAEPLLIKQFTLVLFVLFVGLFVASNNSSNKMI